MYLAYVAAVWSFLSHGGLNALSQRMKNARFQAESGYSFWPGRITVSGAEMVFQDPNITIQILADEVEIDFGVLSILKRELHLERLDADSARVRLRHRVKSDLEGHRERLAAFPVIEGFERSPLRGPRGPRVKDPLDVRIDDIRAEVAEIWIMEYRTVGQFRARGGFRLTDQVVVLPSKVDLSAGRTMVGERKVIEVDDCVLQAELGPFPRRKPSALEIAQSISSRTRCRVDALDLSIAQLYPRQTPFRVMGHLQADANVTLREGKLRKGAVRLFEAKTPWSWRGVRFPMEWNATVEIPRPGAIHAEMHAGIEGGRYSTRVRRAEVVLDARHDVFFKQELQRLEGKVEGAAFEQGDFLRQFTGTSDAPRLRLHPSRGKVVYAPRDGSLEAHADLSASLDLKNASMGVHGKIVLQCSFGNDDAVRCERMSLDAQGLSYEKDAVVESLPVNVRATEFEGQLPRSLDARFVVETGNPKKFLQHALGLDFCERVGMSLLPLGPLEATLDLAKDEGTLVGIVPELRSGDLRLRGRFVSATAMTSAWLFGTPAGNYGVRQRPTGLEFHPWVEQDWFASCEARLSPDC